jgi:hypothetical protein
MNEKRIVRFILIVLILVHVRVSAQEFPTTQISNKQITAKLYLPDPERGYYRASRFDWSGVVYSLMYKGHTYFGQWFDQYDPFLHEAVMGPVEAFDPLGYAQAKGDEPFTKIGIGRLQRIDTLPYHHSKPYKIVDHGKWTTQKRKNRITFIHELTGNYAYHYTKVIRIQDNKMIIDHTLVNKAEETIETSVFNHNFFYIDKTPIGPGYTVTFPFTIQGDATGLGEFAGISGNQVHYKKELKGADRARIRAITGFSSSADDYMFTIENTTTGAGVKITCDRPLSRLILWSAPKALCPEPYITIKLEPSEAFTWSITYEFFTR